MARKILIYNTKTISTSFGHNTDDFYYNILLTVVCIVWPEVWLKPRYFALHLMENRKVKKKIVSPFHTRSHLTEILSRYNEKKLSFERHYFLFKREKFLSR